MTVGLVAVPSLYCLAVITESVGKVCEAKIKYSKLMYVYHSVRKLGYVYELCSCKDKLYRCVRCKRFIGKSRYIITIVNEATVCRTPPAHPLTIS